MRVKMRREPERRGRKGKNEAENCGKLKEKDRRDACTAGKDFGKAKTENTSGGFE